MQLWTSQGEILNTKTTSWLDTPHLEQLPEEELQKSKNNVMIFRDFPRTTDFDGVGFALMLAGAAASILGSMTWMVFFFHGVSCAKVWHLWQALQFSLTSLVKAYLMIPNL